MIDYQAIADAGGFGKGTPRVVARMTKHRRESAEIKACYAKVDARDGRRCQFPHCKRAMRKHHHVWYRSTADRAVKHTTGNVVSLCLEHESWVHSGLVTCEGDANRGLRWAVTAIGLAAKVTLGPKRRAR